MKKIKIALLPLLLVLSVLMLTVCVGASGGTVYHGYVFDCSDDLLTAAEESVLQAQAEQLAQNYHADVMLAVAEMGDSYFGDFSFYDYPAISYDSYITLVVTYTDTWHYDMEWKGVDLSENQVDKILDHPTVYDNLKDGKIYDGLTGFLQQTDRRLAPTPLGTKLLFGLIASFVITAAVVVIVILRYNMKIKPTNYPLDKYARLELTHSNEQFCGSNVTSYTRSSSSGGRSGGGGHRGGGHSGR